MTLTAFLPTGAPQVLPFIGTPGAATVGHALVWSESPQGFTLAPISVGPDQFSGVLPVAKGGWGTATGSFTSPGAITLTAGGTNQNINLVPSGAGVVTFDSAAIGVNPDSPGLIELLGAPRPKQIVKSNQQLNIEYFTCSNFHYESPQFLLTRARGTILSPQSCLEGDTLGIIASAPIGNSGGVPLAGNAGTGFVIQIDGPVVSRNPPTRMRFIGVNTASDPVNFAEFNSTRALIPQVTESTSTTTGALQCAGGLGVAKNVNIGGNLKVFGAINFANLPTSNTGLAQGDLWRDGEIVKVKL